jgi:hypothetical protein
MRRHDLTRRHLATAQRPGQGNRVKHARVGHLTILEDILIAPRTRPVGKWLLRHHALLVCVSMLALVAGSSSRDNLQAFTTASLK